MPVDIQSDPVVEVRRSRRRRRTVSAYRDGDTVVVLIPDRFTPDQERAWVKRMVKRLDDRGSRARAIRGNDTALFTRAQELAKRYLGPKFRPASVRWVTNQRSRWASCTPSDGTIRLSRRLDGMPGWVVDYVLIHELAHLAEPDHNDRFWELVNRYPKAQRARGYLEGVAAAAGLKLDDEDTEHAETPTPAAEAA